MRVLPFEQSPHTDRLGPSYLWFRIVAVPASNQKSVTINQKPETRDQRPKTPYFNTTTSNQMKRQQTATNLAVLVRSEAEKSTDPHHSAADTQV